MAKFIREKPAEARFVLEFSASELKLLADVFGDMGDGRIVLDYSEGDRVKPNKKSLKKIQAITAAFDLANFYNVTDDYFDRWEKVK